LAEEEGDGAEKKGKPAVSSDSSGESPAETPESPGQ